MTLKELIKSQNLSQADLINAYTEVKNELEAERAAKEKAEKEAAIAAEKEKLRQKEVIKLREKAIRAIYDWTCLAGNVENSKENYTEFRKSILDSFLITEKSLSKASKITKKTNNVTDDEIFDTLFEIWNDYFGH